MTDNEIFELAEHFECIVDNHNGVYIPQTFIESYWDNYVSNKNHLRHEHVAIKHGDPYGEGSDAYWDAWDNILNSAILINDNGVKMLLVQNCDLFAYPAELDIPEEFWENWMQ